MAETHVFLIALATVLFCFAATCPSDPVIRPWMRASSVAIGLTACLWFPWVALVAARNYEACFGAKPERTIAPGAKALQPVAHDDEPPF